MWWSRIWRITFLIHSPHTFLFIFGMWMISFLRLRTISLPAFWILSMRTMNASNLQWILAMTGINFLDVKLLIDRGRIIFDIYKKPKNSGRYLNFYSNRPISHKRGVVIGLLDRVLFLSHPKFHNICSLITTLQRNGYPLQFLFAINNRIKIWSVKKNFNFIKEHNVNFHADTS